MENRDLETIVRGTMPTEEIVACVAVMKRGPRWKAPLLVGFIVALVPLTMVFGWAAAIAGLVAACLLGRWYRTRPSEDRGTAHDIGPNSSILVVTPTGLEFVGIHARTMKTNGVSTAIPRADVRSLRAEDRASVFDRLEIGFADGTEASWHITQKPEPELMGLLAGVAPSTR